MNVSAYQCWIGDDSNIGRIINSHSPGAAKAAYFRDIGDIDDRLTFTDIKCRKIGAPQADDQFERVAAYRNVKFAKCGMKVKVGNNHGVIVGANSSCNFNVLFVNGPNKGLTLNCHPLWMMTYFNDDGDVLFNSEKAKTKEASE